MFAMVFVALSHEFETKRGCKRFLALLFLPPTAHHLVTTVFHYNGAVMGAGGGLTSAHLIAL